MKTVVTVFLGLTALILGACRTPAENTSANRNADTTKPIAAAPTADALLALDKQANEAYIKSASKFFERVLSDMFVMHEGGQQMDKAAVIKMIAGNKCDVKDWKLEDPEMAPRSMRRPTCLATKERLTEAAPPWTGSRSRSQARSALRLFGLEPATRGGPRSTAKI